MKECKFLFGFDISLLLKIHKCLLQGTLISVSLNLFEQTEELGNL